MSATITDVLLSHGVTASVLEVQTGAAVDRHVLSLAPGQKVSAVTGLSSELSLALGTSHVRVTTDGGILAIEVPAAERTFPAPAPLTDPHPLAFVVGVDVTGETVTARLSDLPHLLVAGTTGSGKSVFLSSLICQLAAQPPSKVRMLLADPKRVELSMFARLPHLMGDVATEVGDIVAMLSYAVQDMEERYTRMQEAGVRNGDDIGLPYLVVIVDEIADLVLQAKAAALTPLTRLAQLGRAANVHLVAATQTPKAEVLPTILRNNLPSRMVFALPDHTASNVALGRSGAEALLGKGDGLFLRSGAPAPVRVQGVQFQLEVLDPPPPAPAPMPPLPAPAMPAEAAPAPMPAEAAHRQEASTSICLICHTYPAIPGTWVCLHPSCKIPTSFYDGDPAAPEEPTPRPRKRGIRRMFERSSSR